MLKWYEAAFIASVAVIIISVTFWKQPTPMGTPTIITLGIGQTDPSGTFELQQVFSDRVTGLRHYDYPVGGGPGTEVTLMIGQEISNGCNEFLKLIRIQGNTATFEIRYENNNQCPICWWQLEAMGYP